MSDPVCPYDVGAPSTWLANASLPADAKACAIPISEGCSQNGLILESCAIDALTSQGLTDLPYNWIGGGIRVLSLYGNASNETYQNFQDCILNRPGRDGGFRCNDLEALNRGDNCNSLTGAINPPIASTNDTQVCVTGARANTSNLMERCCGNPAVSFEGGCWQYCVAPAGGNVAGCIQSALGDLNYSTANVGCLLPNREANNNNNNESSSSNGASALNGLGMSSSLGLVAVIAYAAGLL